MSSRSSIGVGVTVMVAVVIGLLMGYYIKPSVTSTSIVTLTSTVLKLMTTTLYSTVTTTMLSTVTTTLTTSVTSVSATTVTSTITTTATSTVTSSTSVVAVTTITSIPPLVLTNITQPAQQTQYHGDYTHAGFINSTGPTTLTQIQTENLGIGSGDEMGLTAYSPTLIFADNGQSGHVAQYNLQTENVITLGSRFDGIYIPIAYGTAILYWPGIIYYSNLCISYGESYVCGDLWSTNLPNEVYGPYITVYGGLVIDAGGDGMEALNVANGVTVWTDNSLTAPIGYTTGTVTTIPTVGGDLVVVGLSSPNAVMAFNVGTGQYAWSILLNSSSIIDTPAYSDGYFYFTTSTGYLYKVSLSGRVVWVDNLGSTAPDTPAVAYGALYIGTSNGLLLAINASTGSIVWYDKLGSAVLASPIVSINRIVYVATSTGMVYAINAQSGEVLSSYNVNAPVSANPVLTDGYLLILDNNGILHVFKP